MLTYHNINQPINLTRFIGFDRLNTTAIMISITTILQIHSQMQMQYTCRNRGTLLFRYELFINFLTSVHWHVERDTIHKIFSWSYHANPTPDVRPFMWWLRSQFISIPAEIRKTQIFDSMAESPTLNGRNLTVCLQGPMSTFNWLFLKILKFSGPSLPGMTSSTLQPLFLSSDLIWQWWLWYPLRPSVSLHPMTMPWTKRLESFKALPNWMMKYN